MVTTARYHYHWDLPHVDYVLKLTGALYDLPALATVERGQGNEGNTRSG